MVANQWRVLAVGGPRRWGKREGRRELSPAEALLFAGAEVGGAKFVKYTFPPSIAKRFTKLCMGVD
jgi:hypothetical protein